MKVTIEVDSESEMDKLSAFFNEFHIDKVDIVPNSALITKGDKSIDPKALFGIWSDSPRTIEDIRKKAWERKSN